MEALEEHVLKIKDALLEENLTSVQDFFNDLDVADIGECIIEFEQGEIVHLFRLVDSKRRPQVFAYLPFELQEMLLEELSETVVTSILNEMEPVDRTKLLEELTFAIRETLLSKMTQEERSIALRLLSYPENSVGRLMTPEFLALKPEMLGHQALEYLRWHSDYGEEAIHHMFVVDSAGKYIGDVSLSSIVLKPGQNVTDLMAPAIQGLDAVADKEEAVDHFRKYDRSFSAVVDENNVVIGVVSAEDIFDVAEDEATEDIQQFGGQATLEHSYFETTLFSLIQKRGVWLSLLFFGELITVAAMKNYEEAISSMKFLIYFVPLIIASGGNSGTQAASLIIRGLAIREMELPDWWRVFRREVVTGLSLGLLLGMLGFFRVITWGEDLQVAWVIFFSLIGVVTFGATIGSMMPFLLKRIGIDPAISSSPFIACIVDCVGIIIYFSVASYFIGL